MVEDDGFVKFCQKLLIMVREFVLLNFVIEFELCCYLGVLELENDSFEGFLLIKVEPDLKVVDGCVLLKIVNDVWLVLKSQYVGWKMREEKGDFHDGIL